MTEDFLILNVCMQYMSFQAGCVLYSTKSLRMCSRRAHMHSCFGCWLPAHTSSVQCYSRSAWYLQCPFRLQMYFMVHTGNVISLNQWKNTNKSRTFEECYPWCNFMYAKWSRRKKRRHWEDSEAEYVLTNVSTLARMYVSVYCCIRGKKYLLHRKQFS